MRRVTVARIVFRRLDRSSQLGEVFRRVRAEGRRLPNRRADRPSAIEPFRSVNCLRLHTRARGRVFVHYALISPFFRLVFPINWTALVKDWPSFVIVHLFDTSACFVVS